MDNLAQAFTLSLPGSSGGRDALDLWQAHSRVSSLPSITDSAGEIGSIWRAELPEDPLEAFRRLDFHQYELEQTRKALPAALPPADLERSFPGGQASYSQGLVK
jgi:hypothetical protein